MSSLADLQAVFARALRDPASPVPRPVRNTEAAPSTRRFNVYRNNMVVSLVDALKAAFPAIHRLVGEDYFNAVARAYIDKHPPSSPVLLRYGRRFGDFLEQFPTASGVPYLGDVARLEWAHIHALHAADAEPAAIESLASLPEKVLSSARLELHPSVMHVASRWPVVALWSACVNPDDAGDVDMNTAQTAVVSRPALRVGVHAAPPGGGAFLAALAEGSSLGVAAAQAMEADEAFDLAGQLQFVFQIGAVATVNPQQQ